MTGGRDKARKRQKRGLMMGHLSRLIHAHHILLKFIGGYGTNGKGPTLYYKYRLRGIETRTLMILARCLWVYFDGDEKDFRDVKV